MARDANAWIDREIAGCRFADERLSGRLRTLLAQMAGAMGGSIPLAVLHPAARAGVDLLPGAEPFRQVAPAHD
jgi:hypothetical protein